jgi:hypothetical protein
LINTADNYCTEELSLRKIAPTLTFNLGAIKKHINQMNI